MMNSTMIIMIILHHLLTNLTVITRKIDNTEVELTCKIILIEITEGVVAAEREDVVATGTTTTTMIDTDTTITTIMTLKMMAIDKHVHH